MEITAAQTVSEKKEETVETAEEIVRHPFVKKLLASAFTPRLSFCRDRVLAIMVALGERGGKLADPVGALGTVAQLPSEKFF